MILRPYGNGVVVDVDHTRIAVDTPAPVHGAKHIVTHAHMDHLGAARRVPALGTIGTAYLAAIRGATVCPVREFEHITAGDVEIELVPAGHIPGSAQVCIHNGKTILITGDFKIEPDIIEMGADNPEADVLVLETTFASPDFVFPPRKELYRKLIAFVRSALDAGEFVVLFAYDIGKAQEITALLNTVGMIPIVTKQAHAANMALGLQDVPIGSPGWREHLEEHAPLVLPLRFSRALRELRLSLGGSIRTLRVSGWNPKFPLSSHADFRQTLSFVERISPELVVTYGDNALTAALELKRRGFEAIPLTKPVFL